MRSLGARCFAPDAARNYHLDAFTMSMISFPLRPLVGSLVLIFYVWALPSLVPRDSFIDALYLIGAATTFIGGLFRWHRDHALARQLEESPEDGEAIWDACKRGGTPYGVYLRSFNHERRQNSFPIPFVGGGGSPRRIELLLVKTLQGRLPLLAFSDPDYPFSMPGAHRFRRMAEPWPITLERLVRGSSLIIIYVAEHNPGLQFEIDLVRELGLTNKTLVIIPSVRGAFKSFSDFRWVLNPGAPQFEDTLDEILRSFDNPDRGWRPDEAMAASSTTHKINMAAQVLAFLLPLILAYALWGTPDSLLRFLSHLV